MDINVFNLHFKERIDLKLEDLLSKKAEIDYYGAAEPLVRSGESHPSGKAEPPLWCEINSLFLFVNRTFPSWRACLPDS